MTQVSCSFKASAASGLNHFSVGSDGVSLVRPGVIDALPFAYIESVRLAYMPSRFDTQRYCCDIAGRGGKRMRVLSTSYVGPGQFESHAAEYRAAILALHSALAGSGHPVQFGSGISGPRYALNIGCAVVAVPIVLALLIGMGSAIGVPAFLHLLVMLALLPFAWRWLRNNRPQRYSPSAVPPELLPPVAAGEPASAPAATPAPAAPAATAAEPARAPTATPGPRRYIDEDFGPIAEPGDQSWYGPAGTKTHWADAERYAQEANEKLDAGLIGPPKDPPPQGEQPL